MKSIPYILLFFISFNYSKAENINRDTLESNIFRDLEIIEQLNNNAKRSFPFYYKNILTGGYIIMPSARMPNTGTTAFGIGTTPIYSNYNIAFQPCCFIELSGSYRICKGIIDPILTKHGFGNYADKGANIKLGISPELSDYELPGIAIGIEDFIGSKLFQSNYIVLTQVFRKYCFECSLGYGWKHYKGWFGGFTWMPFLDTQQQLMHNIAITAEYDSTDYTKEFHPMGRSSKNNVNVGIKYSFLDNFDLNISHIKGKETACALAVHCNMGKMEGLLPKYKNPLPYTSPINTEPIGELRPEQIMMQDLIYTFEKHGFNVLSGSIETVNNEKTLFITMSNNQWREEHQLHLRIQQIISALSPTNIDKIIVHIEKNGLICQQYSFYRKYLNEYSTNNMGEYELYLLSPMQNATFHNTSRYIFKKNKKLFNISINPKLRSFFGSASGKYKYDFGILGSINGYIANFIYYNMALRYTICSSMDNMLSIDMINPSQLINVRSDLMLYRRNKSFNLEQAYLQKNLSLGYGLYSKLSAGYFEYAYGGIAAELLYYPVSVPWAIGIEGAILKKRHYHGLGFQDIARKLVGYKPTYQKFKPKQYFVDFYYHIKPTSLELKFKVGKFLGKDIGIRSEIGRHFSSGLKIFLWYTYTNANDYVNNKRYHDQGVGFSMPLDIFYTHNSTSRCGYRMSAWLRDTGAEANTGMPLYETIFNERYNY